MSRAELERAAELTRRAGAWLVMDNTYGVGNMPRVKPHCMLLCRFLLEQRNIGEMHSRTIA